MAHNDAGIDDRMESEPDQVDDEYISSDQENKKSSRNARNTNESLPIFSGAEHADDYDASILVNHPSNSHGSPKNPPVLQVDARLRRLLELEEKALKLSELVSGIKSKKTRTSTFSPAPNRAEETADMKKESYLQIALHDMEIDRSESGKRLSINERRDESVDEENRSEGEESYSDRESASNNRNGTYESEKDSSVSEQSRLSDEESSELHAMNDFQRKQGLDAEEIRSPADTFMDIEVNIEKTANLDSGELDPRYIGVHNIRGEWPIERHQLDDYDIAVNRSPSSSRLSSSSSHSGGQFVEQHPSPSNRGSLSPDGSEQAGSDVFETSIHTYIQQRLHSTSSALRRSTDVSITDGPSEGKSSKFGERDGLAEITAKDITFQSIQPKQYGLRDTIALKANDKRRRAEAQEAFLKMVRDTDDSLSVINSTATKIWLEQQQRAKARMEQKLQQEQEREKEEQRMKDELLKSVMDSLWVKPDACDESDQIESHDDGDETMFKYERLEDIMQEVQKEWMLEKQERDLNVIVGSRTQASAASDEVDQANSAVTYWNDMLTNSSPLQQSKNSLKTKASMPRTVIDTSELDQQRAQQQQLEDELTESYKNEIRRVHSPKTLARLLLAEVDYHEAIHDAHLQLTMMEQAQVVEQAHVETIHVANAFKEEMENSMANHQIALEHAILAQQFDGDLHDVMHELKNIQQTQTNEAAIASASLHLELRKANMRESTVQTDELKRVDATTNAKLHVESGTTNSPGVSDAAVQYEFPEEGSINPSNDLLNQPHTRVADQVIFSNTTGTVSSAEHGYSEEDYEDENFEPASHSVVDSNHHKSNDASIADVASSVVGAETSKSVYESDHSEAEMVSKDDDEASTSKLKQSATASDPYEDDEIYSEQSVEEGESGGSKAESIPSSEIGDVISDDEKNYPSDTGGNASTSMGYDDDFEVSHQVQPVDQNVEDESFEDEDEGSPGASVTSEIDDEVGEHSEVKISDGLVSTESKYSSEFSENVEVEQAKSGLDILNLLPTSPHNTERAELQVIATAVQSTRYMVEHASEPLRYNAIYGPDELAQAYQRDLEVRKNSDESLLLLRLQVLEQHFQRDQLAIEEQIVNANNAASSSKAHLQQTTQELVLRKEALRMAFMSEKANVENSSTTKLLVEQVNALRQQSKDPTEAETKHIEDKIERKKIKALELIQAKERLIKQEKHKFKQEEERRQVDTLAQIALRMDVITELSKAKADIKQELENEMKTLQQVYPTLLGANPVQLQGDVPALGVHQTQQIPNSPNKIKVAKYLTQSKASESQFVAEIEADHEKEDNYEDSFEVEQSAPDIGNEEDKSAAEEEYELSEDADTSHYDRKVESTSNASAIIAEDEDEIASDTEHNEEPERSDVESEIQSDNDGVSDDIQFDAPADDNKLEDEIKDEEESGGGYENEYEDETFDDAQSASFAPEDGHVKSKEYEKKEETNGNAGADALGEDEYSDESFEKGSGSPSTHSSDDKLINVTGVHVVDDIVPQIEKADGNLDQEEQQQEHVSIGDLSTALDAVASPLHSLPVDVEEASAGKIEKDLSVDESNVFPSASITNLSGSASQEEILSKSIEEQAKRLEELKQMILSRKDEIVSVQKHMRIEKRREQLSAEEKLLWDEMERVGANLRLDEAALELSRQRNRLESMQLEAKHSGYKMQSKTNINVDLLGGFAYIETAEEPIAEAEIVRPKEPTKKNTVWGATSDMTCQTDGTMVECDEDLDLLRGYAYVEDAEVGNFQLSSVELSPVAGKNDADESMPYSVEPAILDEPGRTDAIERETDGVATEVSGNIMGDHVLDAHVALQTEAVLDLLDGYAYIEDALQAVESEKDLLVGFHHVEGADPLSADDACGLQSNMEPLASDVAADLAAREVKYSFGKDDILSSEDDECEVQHIASDDETPTEDENHSTLAEPFEVSESDHDRVQVQSEDDSDVVQSVLQYQGDDEIKYPGDESVLQGAEQNADIGRRASEDLVDCVADAIYAKMFDSVMRGTNI
uniref:Uncharacterized protein n=1 Tax=Globisporangium ultimum (strain ATCC 200006 / CBS 805.95 / DAOM BR144) TaxID=431595 RepID=K3WGM4_GLOUD